MSMSLILGMLLSCLVKTSSFQQLINLFFLLWTKGALAGAKYKTESKDRPFAQHLQLNSLTFLAPFNSGRFFSAC